MHQLIRQYLQGGSFLQGLDCYRQTGGPQLQEMERYLTAHFVPEDALARLRHHLLQWLEAHPQQDPVVTPPQDPKTPPQQPAKAPPTPSDREPQSILDLRDKGRHLLKLQAELHTRLKLADSDEARYELAHQLMSELIPQIDRIYDAIRHYEATGDEPPAAQVDDAFLEGVRIMQRRSSLKVRISQVKRMLKKELKEAERQKLEKELLEKQVELREINIKTGLEVD